MNQKSQVIEKETAKILAKIQKGKVRLKKAGILIEDLENQMTLLIQEAKNVKSSLHSPPVLSKKTRRT